MNIIDIIIKKKNKEILSEKEIEYIINGYMEGVIKDYQMSALLMATVINGMNSEEASYLTKYMINSGEIMDLSSIKKVTVDKHSTGGVGDKTTLIVGPIVAACGVTTPKISGRGLGHTGGTIDKLEAIDGFKVKLTKTDFINELKKVGFAVISSNEKIAPADKKIYALRDVTGTVESIPLIASSIMSKKIALGADKIVIDLKVGKGALIKNIDDAKELARIMINIGKSHNKEVICLLTNMDMPLGNSIGNSLEVEEAIEVLSNKGGIIITDFCIELSSYMVSLGLSVPLDTARNLVKEKLENGEAYQKFIDFVKYQGGSVLNFKKTKYIYEVKAPINGFINGLDAYKLGVFCNELGAGRKNKEDTIDYNVGLRLNKLVGDYVTSNDTIVFIHSNKELSNFNDILDSFDITSSKVNNIKMIYDVIS